jgi:sodium/bile acid cotransporter 7
VNLKHLSIDRFILALLLTIAIGRFIPEPALYEGIISLKQVGEIGITLVFFFYGLRLNLPILRKDLSNWKLHLVVQLSTFIIFPLIVLPFFILFGKGENQLLWLGAFFLAALPSTVSSSVVMVSIAKGNVTSAIFNASLSSILGVFITPIWMGIVIAANPAQNSEMAGIITKLVLQVLVPVIAGIILNRFFGHWAESKKRYFKWFEQSVILLIVYLAFAKSFSSNQFSSIKNTDLLLIALLCLALFFSVFLIIQIISKKLNFNRRDTISAQFSGSKKSLVHGTVMSNVLFTGMAGVGVILLPLMLYHALQLVVVGFIAKKMGQVENQPPL